MQKWITKENTLIDESRIYFEIQRVFDLVISVILLIVFLPLIIVLSLTIVIFSGRPIFFKQTRTGLNGKLFVIWKFRTMTTNKNDTQKHKYDWNDKVPNDFVFKTANDLQVTGIGKIFRKYSLDELPQLINVLLGDMSIVGPRPEIPEITNHYDSFQLQRLKVKPGMTGYAQVNGRSEISHGKKIEHDLHYVENCSLVLDFKIIIKTIKIVVKGGGAY